jgi:hypothetical protein
VTLTTILQQFVPYPIDNDTAYHFSVSQLITKYGILYSFPWTPFSWQCDHYADKEFLFHLLFVPVGKLGFVSSARCVGIFAGALILTALYLILRSEKVRYAGVWTLLPLASSAFVFRFAQVRPHLLSITLALIVMWAAARNKLHILAMASIIYPLAYIAFWQIPLILIIAAEFARVLVGGRPRWQPIVVCGAGIAMGVTLHPNAYNIVRINWIHMSEILFRNAWGRKVDFNLGMEFNPYSLVEWGKFLVFTVLMTGIALVFAWKQRKKSSIPLAITIATVFFGLITLKTNRFLEYFVPFSVLSVAIASRDYGKNYFAPVMLAILLLYMFAVGTDPWKILTSIHSNRAYMEPSIANYFNRRIPEGAQIFTPGWDYTGNLMLILPERRFIVAADPTLFYKKDPYLYSIWRRIPLEAPIDSGEAIRKLFRARYVISLNYPAYWTFFDALSYDPKVKNLFANERWVLFDLGETSVHKSQHSY